MTIQERLRDACAALASIVVLAGCVSSGMINARLENPTGGGTTPVEMEYDTDRFGAGGTLETTLPNGEVFSGRYLQVTSSATADTLGAGWGGWGPWGAYWNDWGAYGSPWVGGDDYSTFIQNYSGKVLATLFGDRGDTMRCRFQLADPEEGMGGGGIGQCQTSDGEKIQAQF